MGNGSLLSHGFLMMRIFFSCLVLIALAGCAPLGVAAGAGAALGVSAASERGVGGTASDLKIKALISEKWFQYDLETFAKLNLTVNEGRVLITGIVQDPDDRVEAVKLAWQIEGVNQVINEIRVADGQGVPGYVKDQWITTRLRTAMTFDREIHSINYSIDTVGGTIYLMGIARNQTELNKVIEIARTIPNVQQVINYVRLSGDAGAAASPQGAPSSLTAPSAAPEWQPEPASPGYGVASPPAAVESEPIDW